MVQKRSKIDSKMIGNRYKMKKIDANMMIGSKMAFWMHLGCLGSHLGAQKGG